MNTPPTLYGLWLSPYMATVAHVLTETNIAFQYERVSPFTGNTHSEEFKTKNPFGKVPCFQDSNGVVVSESMAICRYLARTYPNMQLLYPCDDAKYCAHVDTLNDFITFSLSGSFLNWLKVGVYYPVVWKMKTEKESQIYSAWSKLLIEGALNQLSRCSSMSPYLLGQHPVLPDFHLFHILELGKTYADMFEMPELNLIAGNEVFEAFYQAMASRASTKEILDVQAGELEHTLGEIFGQFRKTNDMKAARLVLEALFGHEV